MDDREKKLFQQLGDEMPGVRQNGLEAWLEHLKRSGRTVRDVIADIETAMSPAKAEELQKKLAEYIDANKAAAKRDATQRAEIKALKAALWIKVNWKISSAVAAALLVVVTGSCAYQRYWSRTYAVNAGLRAAVAEATWGEGWGEPFAARIGGEPYWVMYRGDIDATSYSDRDSHPVEMRCVHLYAAPASPNFGEYLKPSPRNFLGWVTWPELAVKCRLSPNQQADSDR
jgi:hypothetical protein